MIAQIPKIRAVLFDLDGTLFDTINDLIFALNQLCTQRGVAPISLNSMRDLASLGSRAMIAQAFNLSEQDPQITQLRQEFFSHYEQHLATTTCLFPNMDQVLAMLARNQLPWGIVTNKLTRHTLSLLDKIALTYPPACIVCGDTLAVSKPAPQPILHACQLLQQLPNHCLYIGDARTDVIASKQAGTVSLVALYGYIRTDDHPAAWQADGYIHDPLEIIDWLSF